MTIFGCCANISQDRKLIAVPRTSERHLRPNARVVERKPMNYELPILCSSLCDFFSRKNAPVDIDRGGHSTASKYHLTTPDAHQCGASNQSQHKRCRFRYLRTAKRRARP